MPADTRLKPANRCAGCGKQELEPDEKRIVATTTKGLTFADAPSESGNRQSRPLANGRHLIWWGVDDATVERAAADLGADRRPWLCQRCANRLCRRCGSVLRVAQGADLLKPDGSVRHQMIVPTEKTCTNPACERFLPPFA